MERRLRVEVAGAVRPSPNPLPEGFIDMTFQYFNWIYLAVPLLLLALFFNFGRYRWVGETIAGRSQKWLRLCQVALVALAALLRLWQRWTRG